MLPPGGRNWQLISPHCKKVFNCNPHKRVLPLPRGWFHPVISMVRMVTEGKCSVQLTSLY